MSGGLPAISGTDLMALLEDNGWIFFKKSKHGFLYCKDFPSGRRRATIPNKSKSLPPGTLSAILSDKQTGLGRKGLLRLLDES